MAPNLAPPARSGAVREASPPTHAVLRIGLNFKFLPGHGGWAHGRGSATLLRLPAQPAAASSTPKGRVRSPSSPSAVAPGWACSIKALHAVKMSLPLFTGEPTFRNR